MMIDKHVDGLIIAGGQQDLIHPAKTYLAAIKRAASTLPLVMIGENIDGISCLFLDRERADGIYDAVKYLSSLGHKRIAFLGGEDGVKITASRVASYKKALSSLGLPVDENLIVLTNYYAQDGYRAAGLLLERGVSFTAALCINDSVALGSLRAFHDKGLHIPEDISLISCELFHSSEFFTPRITALDRCSSRFGRLVIQKLLNVIQNQEENDSLDISPKLIVRASCGPVPENN